MAVKVAFKIACPSCGAPVPVKSAKMVGKKIACPMCKYSFVVEPPEEDKAQEQPEEEDALEMSDAELAALTKRAQAKAADEKAKNSDGAEGGEAAGAKKAGGSKKLVLGLGLGGVGLVVLGVAGFLILGGSKSTPPISKSPSTVAEGPPVTPPTPVKPGTKVLPGTKPGTKETSKTKKEKDTSKASNEDTKVSDPGPQTVSSAGPELTNLLPPDSESVVHVFFKTLFDDHPLVKAALGPGGLVESDLNTRLGLTLLGIDDVIRAEKFSAPAWTFTVAHTVRPVNEKALAKALGLSAAPNPVKNQSYYSAAAGNHWLEQLGLLSFGAPIHLRSYRPNSKEELLVRLHNPHTLILAHETPMLAFLEAEGQFKFQSTSDPKKSSPSETSPKELPAKPPAATQPGFPPTGFPSPGGQPTGTSSGVMPEHLDRTTYMTVSPQLKVMLDRVEQTPNNSTDKLIYSMATNMSAARFAIPALNHQLAWQYRQLWDVSNLLQENRSRVRHTSVALFQSSPQAFRLQNELACSGGAEAKEISLELREQGAALLAGVLDRLLDVRIELPRDEKEKKEEPAVTPPDGKPDFTQKPPDLVAKFPTRKPKVDEPKEKEPAASRIHVKRKEHLIRFTLDLVLDETTEKNLTNAITVLAFGLRNELDLSAGLGSRHSLGKAVHLLSERGLPDKGVAPGLFPPGVFDRQKGGLRITREPSSRVSWMAGLLPYLGQEQLYSRINFDLSWRDPGNWLAARTLVPEFVDPQYPAGSFYVQHPSLPLESAGTHFVGIAGVGLEAAGYSSSDPSLDGKRGVLGYDGSRTLREVKENRGAANTILLIQVPHDGPVGVTPWMAGGGSTLRGVPETKSIAPFVLTTDRNGKTITHQGKRGTFAVMTDGSVRFIDQSISDDVFKAMCTYKGPAPDLGEWAPLVAPQKKQDKGTSPTAAK